MKNIQNYFPPALLLAYAIYSTFIQINVAHSIIILSLAILAGYQAFLSRQENTKFNKEILEQMREDFGSQLNGVKEFYDKKLSKLEDEVAKVQLNTMPTKASSSSPAPRKLVF